MTTTDVEHRPGYAQGIQGSDLMKNRQAHAERFKAEMIADHIARADPSVRPFRLTGEVGRFTFEYCAGGCVRSMK
ncbi:hypothetical protein [Advenella mimigardefordensis]|uniref:hypothetical protein n=1 Tax=Advenella mimigardefordensis TaxID=302406 RepID=UPI00046D434B|nr:hypothetical protein [Advenella mimigardefordensis]